MDIRDAARDYLRRGFAPIPIPARSKAPSLPDWPNLRIEEKDMDELFTENVGLLLGTPSRGLVDVDLDARETIALAPLFLPPTAMIHGRASRPRSHWWFIVDPAPPTKRFQDTDGTCLVELRSTGGQTVVPPSVHPEGEAIEWADDNEPAIVPPDTLSTAVRRLAAAALLVRHYPAQGGRQDFALALAGLLLKAGWEASKVEHFVTAVAEAAHDEEAQKRAATVRRTQESIAQGKRVTGFRALSDAVGDAVVKRLTDWLDIPRGRRTPDNRAPADANANGNALEQLLDLVSAAEIFHSAQDEAFVTIHTPRKPESIPVESLAFASWVSRTAIERLGFVPRDQILKELKHQVAGEAIHNRPSYPVYVRVAGDATRIFIDLADEARNIIEVTAEGWRLAKDCPVRFFRPSGMEALPMPKPCKGLEYFQQVFNCGSDDDLRLLVAFLAFAWNPLGPYPILILQGEAGSGKSTIATMLRRIIDPASVPLRSFPREEREFVIAARTSHMLCFDNLSGISDRDSDTLCRISTGAGFAARKLYSDWDEVRFKMRRPVVINGIDDLATRPDLIDRSIALTLPAIESKVRADEATLWWNFEAALPHLIGATLDILATALTRLPLTTLPETPRMADFARWSTAAEPALGWAPGGFLQAFRCNQEASLEVGAESSPLTEPIRRLLADRSEWSGTSSDLLEHWNAGDPDHTRVGRTWPRNPAKLANQLRRLVNPLRVQGISVEFSRAAGNKRTRLISIRQVTTVTGLPATTVPAVPGGKHDEFT